MYGHKFKERIDERDAQIFERFIQTASDLSQSYPHRTLEQLQKQTYADFFDYFKWGKDLIKPLVLKNPDSVKELCTAFFEYLKSIHVRTYMVDSKRAEDGYTVMPEYFGPVDPCDLNSPFKVAYPVKTVDDILNFHLRRPLNYMKGILEEPWPPHCPEGTLEVNNLEAWLDYFQVQCARNEYLKQFREKITTFYSEAKEGTDINSELTLIVETIQEHNRSHLADFIEGCYQIICGEISDYT